MPLPVRRPPLPLPLSLACAFAFAFALANSGCGDATLTVHEGLATGRAAPIRLEARSLDVDGTRVAYRLLTLSLQQPPDGRPGRAFWVRYAVFDGVLLRPRR